MGEKWYYALMKMSLRIFTIILVSALLLAGIGIYLAQAQKPVENAVKGVQTQSTAGPSQVKEIVPLNADKILELVNAERAKVGVAPLVSDPRLVATAQARADDMVARNYFSHYDPVTGESLVKIKPTNPQCVSASENISSYQPNSNEVVTGWVNSRAHYAAMVDARYTLTGVAVKNRIVVQHFCQQ